MEEKNKAGGGGGGISSIFERAQWEELFMNLNRSVARYIDCTLPTLCAARASVYASLSAALSIIAPGKCAESGISRDLTRPAATISTSIINRRQPSWNLKNARRPTLLVVYFSSLRTLVPGTSFKPSSGITMFQFRSPREFRYFIC